jgi:uncharacterized protein (TIGR02452 family)
MKKSTRIQLAKETLDIIEAKSYRSPKGKLVTLADALRQGAQQTMLFEGSLMPPLPAPMSDSGADLTIEVTNESTFVALQRLAPTSSHLGCLNFASAKNPGGGFLSGAEAQEEALSRASGLYPSLLRQRQYYERNQTNHSSLYLDLLILSPRIPFFRDDAGSLIEDCFEATVVTAPAPNAGAVAHNEPERVGEIVPCLQRRAELVLRAFALAGTEVLVLGAWGCGVFRNDPSAVAQTFRSLLRPGGPYAKHFKQVVFAIYDPTAQGPNYLAFQNQFK